MANSVDPDQTAPIGAVCSGSTLFASILNSSVLLGNYLQQTASAENIFRCVFFLGALRVKDTSRSALGADQTVPMHRLVCVFDGHMQQNQVFSRLPLFEHKG